MIYQLNNLKQGHELLKNQIWPFLKERLAVDIKLIVNVQEINKSREQEEKYHAIIGDIAKQAQHMGAKWDAESWKRLLVDLFCKEIGLDSGKVIPSLDGAGIVQLGFQTRKFTKSQASEFVEWLIAWCSKNGIEVNYES